MRALERGGQVQAQTGLQTPGRVGMESGTGDLTETSGVRRVGPQGTLSSSVQYLTANQHTANGGGLSHRCLEQAGAACPSSQPAGTREVGGRHLEPAESQDGGICCCSCRILLFRHLGRVLLS